MKRIPTEYIHRRYTDGYATPGLVGDMLQKKYEKGISKEEEEAVQNIAYTVYSGASDTTISATASFFYYMATCPDVQRKAHEEIDRVVGSKRLPDYDDRLSGRMPFMEAIYREVLRIAAPLPLGFPHAVSEDDHYKGYFIPKETKNYTQSEQLTKIVRAMTHDANKYPAPFIFRPERFLDRDGNLNNDSRVLAYGFGRRICVGKYVGSSTLWLIMASVLSCFIIEKKKDEKGEDIEIADDFEEAGVFRHKKKFDCSFRIRSPEAQGLVMGIKSG
ncbi:hypothetical protein D9613_008553 [Agrocybe pediades]|uniref:Cytochrome P450 n=1 Tax=Agrocybe pediades TaxID=84607 RepID=A0A8H4QSU4_9AGAR|nr:hypothetical protein D9613_008553 [Agrocybe pediades]